MCVLGHHSQPATGHNKGVLFNRRPLHEAFKHGACKPCRGGPLPITTVVKAVGQAYATGIALVVNNGYDALAKGTANATKGVIAAAFAITSAEACNIGGVSKVVAEAVPSQVCLDHSTLQMGQYLQFASAA